MSLSATWVDVELTAGPRDLAYLLRRPSAGPHSPFSYTQFHARTTNQQSSPCYPTYGGCPPKRRTYVGTVGYGVRWTTFWKLVNPLICPRGNLGPYPSAYPSMPRQPGSSWDGGRGLRAPNAPPRAPGGSWDAGRAGRPSADHSRSGSYESRRQVPPPLVPGGQRAAPDPRANWVDESQWNGR